MQWACEMSYIITIQINGKIYNKCKKYINTSQIFFLIAGIDKRYIVRVVIYWGDKWITRQSGDWMPRGRSHETYAQREKIIFIFFGKTTINRGLPLRYPGCYKPYIPLIAPA